MRALFALTVANIRSFVRDRAALFWTLAFPLIFVVLFGLIFSGPSVTLKLAFVDLDNTPASQQLHDAFASVKGVILSTADHDTALETMKTGKVRDRRGAGRLAPPSPRRRRARLGIAGVGHRLHRPQPASTTAIVQQVVTRSWGGQPRRRPPTVVRA
jgi:hypothetical protein